MLNKSILILGDSLSFPRAHKGQCLHETWPAIIQARTRQYVWNRSKVKATSRDLLAASAETIHYCATDSPNSFTMIVVQVGIVDATPRMIGLRLTELLDAMPRGGTRLAQVIARAKAFFRVDAKTWVSEHEYYENLKAIADNGLLLAERVVFIHIAPPMHYMKKNIPASAESVKRFNVMITRLAEEYAKNQKNVYECNPFSSDCGKLILPDGHHLTIIGHERVADEITLIMGR